MSSKFRENVVCTFFLLAFLDFLGREPPAVGGLGDLAGLGAAGRFTGGGFGLAEG
jgi:hypothetical protein